MPNEPLPAPPSPAELRDPVIGELAAAVLLDSLGSFIMRMVEVGRIARDPGRLAETKIRLWHLRFVRRCEALERRLEACMVELENAYPSTAPYAAAVVIDELPDAPRLVEAYCPHCSAAVHMLDEDEECPRCAAPLRPILASSRSEAEA